MTIIDIKTKIIKSDFNVYALFPGQGYKHRQAMIDRGLVFLDFPDLTLPNDLKGYMTRNFTRQVARSEAIADWISGGKLNDNKPMMRLSHYKNMARGPKRGRYINSLQGLHLTAKKGELVILPTAGHYDDIMIGEFVDEPNKPIYIEPSNSYEDYKVPARRVRWVGRKPQHQVTEEFLRSIRTSNPLVLVKRSDRRQLYDVAYPSYTIGDDIFSTFAVKGESFTSIDDYFFQEFVNYAAAVLEHVEKGRRGQINSDVGEAILALNDESYFADLAININSPGLINLFSKRITPLVASALFALSLASCNADGSISYPKPDEIRISIGGNVDDPCAIDIQNAVIHSLESMGYEEWAKMCRKIRKLSDDPQIAPPASVKN